MAQQIDQHPVQMLRIGPGGVLRIQLEVQAHPGPGQARIVAGGLDRGKQADHRRLRRPFLGRIVVGSIVLMVINAVVHGFVIWLPTFFILQGMSMVSAFHFALVMSLGAPLGAGIAAVLADRLGRKPTVALACVVAMGVAYFYPSVRDPVLLPIVGLALTAPIFVLMALLFGIYIPELFPTELRLRAAGICNTFGRGATIVTPFIVIYLFDTHGVAGVTVIMEILLAILALVLVIFGVEPAKRSLEEITSVSVITTSLPRRVRPGSES